LLDIFRYVVRFVNHDIGIGHVLGMMPIAFVPDQVEP
jgi:hypothetical protein